MLTQCLTSHVPCYRFITGVHSVVSECATMHIMKNVYSITFEWFVVCLGQITSNFYFTVQLWRVDATLV